MSATVSELGLMFCEISIFWSFYFSVQNGAQKPVKRSRFDMKEPVVNIKTENMAETVPVSQPPSSTMPPLNPDQISQMMENVRKQIEERKRKLNVSLAI